MTSIGTLNTTQGQTREIIAISQHERIVDAARVMHENRVGCLVVAASEDDETMVGVISERDILGWISNATPATYFQQVREIMTTNVVSCRPGTPASESLEQMKRHHMRHMPIVEGGKAIGMLSVRDLLESHIL
ncbi:MAG: CBS domain-containing protein [Phycisphaerae bacterium]|jgi:CBS domain-containing protein|nr:CBS domain-containing protein [Phycisphaerae bacterium]